MSEDCIRDELKELGELIGLTSVKEAIEDLVVHLVNERSYRAQGARILPARRHLVFSGPAGVGKRRVARTFGQICARLGALEKGHMVVVDGEDLTAVSFDKKVALMRERCAAALDGVLFIRNDAFLPAGILRSTGDLRLDAVDVMIDFMLRHRGRMLVILDARPNQFDYISFHLGLARLFNQTIAFPPYDVFELLQILAAKARRMDLELPEGIECDLFPWIIANMRRSDWRNACEIGNLFSRAVGQRASRGIRLRRADFGAFERDDFRQALATMQSDVPVLAHPFGIPGRRPRPGLP
ncbi:MAG: hypothetical protein EPN75_12375 [Beijerinckiaceae bacterium]|nr:MAG: hypothetical protein EPN75_12375 [Beijerinckiaceae bacterium]